MIALSLIICTHNPRRDYLERTLASVRAQRCPQERWELLLIDNHSQKPLHETWDLSWHRHARHIREDQLGLTPARLRGIREAKGALIVFADDDNVLEPDYLDQAAALAAEHPQLGVLGAGVLKPEFETVPLPETEPILSMLALRTVPRRLWTNNYDDKRCTPWGAGICVTRAVAEDYLAIIGRLTQSVPLGRRGKDLTCGEDDVFSWAAVQAGLGVGLFPELKITHLISSGRLTREYLVRLKRAHHLSHGVLRFLLAGTRPAKTGPVHYLRALWHAVRHGSFEYQLRLAEAGGSRAARAFIAANQLRPIDHQPGRTVRAATASLGQPCAQT